MNPEPKVYRFKVSLAHNKRTYRHIEILGSQTFADLHESIFAAFERYDSHLYAFFVTRQPTKSTSVMYDAPEITHPMSLEGAFGFNDKKKDNAEETTIEQVNLKEKDRMYYLFDFGDEWWHEITLLKILPADDTAGFPKIVKVAGKSPEQYPDYEDEDDEA